MELKNIFSVLLVGFGFLFKVYIIGIEPLPKSHDFHLSKCSMTYQEDEKILDIQWHIWLDDLELGLQNFGVGDLKLLTGHEVVDADEKLMLYLQTKMSIKN